MKYKHDFSFGDTRGIRDIMLKHSCHLFSDFSLNLQNCGYPPHEGNGYLIDQIKILIKDLTGKDYKYVIVTNGATNGLNAYLYAKKTPLTTDLITNKLYFMFYPGIARNAGLTHIPSNEKYTPNDYSLRIIDSPSNPLGILCKSNASRNVVWDAAYFTPTYCGFRGDSSRGNMPYITPKHDAMVGSLSKLTGLNGLRVGWLATNNRNIADKALEYVTHDLCGVSYPSQIIAENILDCVSLDAFYIESKKMLDDNKDQMSRLNHIFNNQEIPKIGMFALFEVDSSIKRLLNKASVKTMPGSSIGDTRDSMRFNLGNSTIATKSMVDDILKADKK